MTWRIHRAEDSYPSLVCWCVYKQSDTVGLWEEGKQVTWSSYLVVFFVSKFISETLARTRRQVPTDESAHPQVSKDVIIQEQELVAINKLSYGDLSDLGRDQAPGPRDATKVPALRVMALWDAAKLPAQRVTALWVATKLPGPESHATKLPAQKVTGPRTPTSRPREPQPSGRSTGREAHTWLLSWP